MTHWPACVICHAVIPDAELPRYACSTCETRMREQLAYLGRALDELPHHLTPDRTGAGRGGSRITAPTPIRLDVVSLLGSGGIADVLGSWGRELRETRTGDPLPGTPAPDGDALRWAARHHPAVDEYAADIDRIYADTRDALLTTEPRPVGRCRACGTGALRGVPELVGTARCDRCAAEVTPAGLPAPLAAARAGVRVSTLTTWHARGWVAHAPGGTTRRPLYDVRDLDAVARSRARRRPLRAPRPEPDGDRPRVLVGVLDDERADLRRCADLDSASRV